MIINHNMSAINADRNLWQNNFKIGKVQERLSSGLRINRAADDAAGLAISEAMRGQIKGLNQANRNAQDATSLIQTADGALANTSAILTRMRELAVQAANDTYTTNDRQQLQKEIDQLKQELDRTANTTSFNNKNLLDGSASALVSADNALTKVFVRGGLVDTLGISHAGSYKISINYNAQGAAETQVSNVFVDKNINQVASQTTALKNLAQFYDNNGRFLIDNPQTITLVQGNGARASFTIYDNDTLSGVAAKFGNAICATGGLGQSVMWNTSADFCVLTTSNMVTGSAENASGTFVLRSAIAGDDGTITVVADNAVLNAFGFSDFRASNQTSYTVTIFNANTGAQLTQTNLKGNAALGLVYSQVDVKFDSKAALTATLVATAGYFVVSGATVATANTVIHLVDNSQTFQIGANEKQNMASAIGNMKSDALGVDNILLSNITTAGMAITKIDMAYAMVSTQRAYLGAVQNRLETTMNNLQVGAENIQAAESRIRDADMAKEMMEFTRLNILTQAATAMLAQANQQPQQVLQLLGR